MEIIYTPITPSWEPRLMSFFQEIIRYKSDVFFHPHPFTQEYATHIAYYKGKDLYSVQTLNEEISGYGMLRGWDDGFEIPSVGIIIHTKKHGHGLGSHFMHYLHQQARLKGAQKIRLKVYPENKNAISLYEKLGYKLQASEEQQLVGTLLL